MCPYRCNISLFTSLKGSIFYLRHVHIEFDQTLAIIIECVFICESNFRRHFINFYVIRRLAQGCVQHKKNELNETLHKKIE